MIRGHSYCFDKMGPDGIEYPIFNRGNNEGHSFWYRAYGLVVYICFGIACVCTCTHMQLKLPLCEKKCVGRKALEFWISLLLLDLPSVLAVLGPSSSHI